MARSSSDGARFRMFVCSMGIMLLGAIGTIIGRSEFFDSHVQISDDCREALEWFNSLGYQDVASLRFVEIDAEGELPRNFHGFVIEDNAQCLVVERGHSDRRKLVRRASAAWHVVNDDADFLAFVRRSFIATHRTKITACRIPTLITSE